MGKHSEWRKEAKKNRRKRIRQKLAKINYEIQEEERKRREQSPSYMEMLREQEKEEKFQEEEEARIAAEAHARWLKIEEEAQKQWRELQAKLAAAREEKAKQIALIKLEWEKEQERLKKLKEEKERQREEEERRQQKLREQIDDFIENGGDTPEHLKVNIEMNPNKPICPFFNKTAACRFRDSCSRNHIKPGVSRILLIPNFYSHYSLEQGENEHGDSALEFENHETYSHFKEFFYDVLPEMEQYGRVKQFKVCCNHEPHLRGNVYIEYSATREAVRSFRVFNGRWYGGKQLSVEFCNIQSWKSAICGLFFRKTCPKGNSCNFLHVFRNPNNMFYQADRDEHKSPERFEPESDRRNWRWSESPERRDILSDKYENTEETRRKNGSTKHRSKRSRERHRSRSRSRKRSRQKSPKYSDRRKRH